MRRNAVMYLILTFTLCYSARAGSSRADDIHRIEESAEVFQEIMGTPDRAIPEDLLRSAECIGIIPAEKKFAFFVGGNYGKGLATCRTPQGWSAPVFLAVSGGSFGFQFGGTSMDIIMVFRGRNGLKKLLRDKFKIGADASASAGPVGRTAAAGTDAEMRAQILTYSRSRGIFAGISLTGAVVRPDNDGNRAFYSATPDRESILDGKVSAPAEAMVLLQAVSKATRTPMHPAVITDKTQ